MSNEIKAPNWCKDAVMDTRGWRHPRTNELLASRRFTEDEVKAYNKLTKPVKKKATPKKKVVKETKPVETVEVKEEKPAAPKKKGLFKKGK